MLSKVPPTVSSEAAPPFPILMVPRLAPAAVPSVAVRLPMTARMPVETRFNPRTVVVVPTLSVTVAPLVVNSAMSLAPGTTPCTQFAALVNEPDATVFFQKNVHRGLLRAVDALLPNRARAARPQRKQSRSRNQRIPPRERSPGQHLAQQSGRRTKGHRSTLDLRGAKSCSLGPDLLQRVSQPRRQLEEFFAVQ